MFSLTTKYGNTLDLADCVLNSLEMLNYCNGRDFVSIRNKALLSILFDTGM